MSCASAHERTHHVRLATKEAHWARTPPAPGGGAMRRQPTAQPASCRLEEVGSQLHRAAKQGWCRRFLILLRRLPPGMH